MACSPVILNRRQPQPDRARETLRFPGQLPTWPRAEEARHHEVVVFLHLPVYGGSRPSKSLPPGKEPHVNRNRAASAHLMVALKIPVVHLPWPDVGLRPPSRRELPHPSGRSGLAALRAIQVVAAAPRNRRSVCSSARSHA